jgi:hypothetical protein
MCFCDLIRSRDVSWLAELNCPNFPIFAPFHHPSLALKAHPLARNSTALGDTPAIAPNALHAYFQPDICRRFGRNVAENCGYCLPTSKTTDSLNSINCLIETDV